MGQIAAIIIVVILLGLSAFQITLIQGYPLGEYAWGGQQKILSRNLKIGSVTSILIYLCIATLVIDKSKILSLFPEGIIKGYGLYFFAFYFALGIFVNAVSRSKKERMVMTPVVIILFILTLITLQFS